MRTKQFFTQKNSENTESGIGTLFTILITSLLIVIMLLYTMIGNAQIPLVYSENFTHAVAPTTQCTSWNAYRASLLSGYTYSGFNISGSLDPTGISCTNSFVAKQIANSLRSATSIFGVTSDGHNWYVQNLCGIGCGGQPSVELGGDVSGGGCSCTGGYSVRPSFGTGNWGGITGPNCLAASQTMTVTFFVVPVSFDHGPIQSLSLCGNSSASISSLLAITDGEGDTETWTVTGAPTHGVISGLPATAPSDTSVTPAGATYTPAPGYIGTDVFTVTVNNGFQTATTTINVTVNPTPSPIAGPTSVCTGTTVMLSSATPSGSWASSNTTRATIGASSGIVSGLTPGAVTITYGASGCTSSFLMTVNQTPAAITGPSSVCSGSTLTLSDASPGGTWVSSSTATAAIGSFSGVVTGGTAGSATITYTLPGGCNTTTGITVNPSPTAISGPSSVCTGSTTTLINGVSGGAWSSSNTAVASIGASSGVVSGSTPGTTSITYTLTAGCSATYLMTVNATPGAISGPTAVCSGSSMTLTNSSTGGTWISSNPATASIGSTSGVVTGGLAGAVTITYSLGSGCNTSANITVNPLPASISGPATVCTGTSATLTDATTGGTWTSSNPAIATVVAGNVSGIATGTTNITYALSTGCLATHTMTVNPSPSTIGGPLNACPGTTITLTNTVPGGAWSSSSTTIAPIGSASGLVTGGTPGSAAITYTLPAGCNTSVTVTVSPALPAISGSSSVCVGSVTSLTDATAGGSWTTSNAAVVDIDAFGNIAGMSTGSATISYTLGACFATKLVTANPTPTAITGSTNLCLFGTTTLSDAVPSGTWSSSNTMIAPVGSTSGVVSGVGSGIATITYSIGVGCNVTTVVSVSPAPTPITGATHICVGTTGSFANASPGGIWSSSNTGLATITGSGIATGLANGRDTIIYTLPSGCKSILGVPVISAPLFTGIDTLCAWGDTVTISDSIPGGIYVSSLVTVYTAGGSGNGLVRSFAPGTASITYILPIGCSVTETFTVHTLPEQIVGNYHLCDGMTTTLTNSYPGGVWSSYNTGIATVNPYTGVVSGVANGITKIAYTLPTGCKVDTTVYVNTPPAAITGISTICAGTTTTLTDAVSGGYWSTSNPTVAGISTTGTLTGVSAGTATISYIMGASCMAVKPVTINQVPTVFSTVGGGSFCSGGTGVNVVLGGSQTSVNYQLYIGSFPVGFPMAGTGSVLDFGLQTISGTYTIVGTSTGLSCSNSMAGSAVVVANPLPTAYTVTGGGNYCAGTSGLHIGLATSQTGINYQLYNGASTSGFAVAGTGGALDFGLQTLPGTYKVIATNTTTTCTDMMTDSASIAITPVVNPTVSVVSSAGTSVCPGVPVTLSATPVNGGTTPVYHWRVNGVLAPTGAATYSYTPADGDVVNVLLRSNATCALPDTASTSITLNVLNTLTPIVAVAASTGASIMSGTTVTFTATVTGGSALLDYQWELNGTAISGATASTYTTNTLNSGDVVKCIVSSAGPCGNLSGNNSVTMTVTRNATGVQGITTGASVIAMPNPNKGTFTLAGELGAGADATAAIEITNMLGQVIYRTSVAVNNNKINEHIVLGNETANGMYILSLRSGSENQTFHIVKEQ